MYQESKHQESLSENFYQNPVLCGDWPDPAVLRDGDCYYLVTSTARYYPSLTIWRSGDLVSWIPFCNPLPRFCKDVWAPDLLKYNGKYYLYFTASGSNYVSCSDSLITGWCEPVDLKIGRIDPGHCVENGRRYLMLSGGYLVPLSDDGMRVTGEAVQVMEPAPLPDTWDVEGSFPESPKVVRKDGYYYLTYADGGTGGPATAHAVVSARARSLFGPWEFSPYNPIVHTWSRKEKWRCKGHGHLIEDCAGDWWLLYHGYEKGYLTLGRSLLLERVEWTADGWFHLHNTGLCTQPLRKPAGKAGEKHWSLSDDFNGDSLKLTWKMFGENDFFRVHVESNSLFLKAAEASPGRSAPLLISAGDHAYVISVGVEVTEGCEVGVILLYREEYFIGAGWNGREITVYRHGKKFVTTPAAGRRLRLFLRNDCHDVAFYYAIDGGSLHKINYVIATQSMDASAYGGFSSLRPGLYACGKGTGRFTEFRYETDSPLLSPEE